MMTTILTTQLNLGEFSMQFKKIKIIKWLLDLEDSECEFVLTDLEKQVNDLCFQNFNELMAFQYYLTQIPKKMKGEINKIVDSYHNKRECRKLYFQYLKDLKENTDYKEYEFFIAFHRGEELYKYLYNSEEKIKENRFREIRNGIIQRRKLQMSLLYNILCDNPKEFIKRDFTENLPQLFLWIRENLETPVKKLTKDDCNILVALMGGMTYDDMLENVEFSHLIKDYTSINKRIENLPKKFSVNNLTQVMFKILLLKPHVWSQPSQELIIKSIKGVCNE